MAADELYDGPFCILSAVDNRRYKRILYEVLDHDPNHDDIRAFLGRLKSALQARNLTLRGITTDGSALYPEPLAELFDGVPHQVCQFHVIKELTKGVLQAVAKERERLARSKRDYSNDAGLFFILPSPHVRLGESVHALRLGPLATCRAQFVPGSAHACAHCKYFFSNSRRPVKTSIHQAFPLVFS